MRTATIAAVLSLAFLTGCVTSKSSQKLDDLVPKMVPPEKVAHYARDVVWASPDGRNLLLDASWPEGEGPFPVLVWFHGGSWEFFSKEANEGLARYITNRGYVVFNVNFRMAPEVTLKPIVEDALGAVIWAKDHAREYNGDPVRVAVAGHSSGGHLCAMVTVACGDPFFTPTYSSPAGATCQVQASVPVSGVYDFFAEAKHNPKGCNRLVGASPADDPELYRKLSPVSYVRAGLPPTLVVYAEKEDLRPVNEQWAQLLAQAGDPVESYMQPGENHLWPTWHWKKSAKQTYDRMAKFLDDQLKNTNRIKPQ